MTETAPPQAHEDGAIDFSKSSAVTLVVGPNKIEFMVCRHLLTRSSEFFKRALNGRFKEAVEKSVCLSEECPELINLYINWLYTGDLPLSIGADESEVVEKFKAGEGGAGEMGSKCTHLLMMRLSEHALTFLYLAESDDEIEWAVYLRLIKLAMLADVLQDHEFQNAVIDRYIESTLEDDVFILSHASYVFKRTTTVSPLRNLIVDMHSIAGFAESKKSRDYEEGPIELWKEVARRVEIYYRRNKFEKSYLERPWRFDRRRYHAHSTDGFMACEFCNVEDSQWVKQAAKKAAK